MGYDFSELGNQKAFMDQVAFEPDFQKQIDLRCEKLEEKYSRQKNQYCKGTEKESQKRESVWFENIDV